METIRQHLGSTILQNLESQINAYDYDEALKTLKGIAESIGGQPAGKCDNNEKETPGLK